MCEAFRANIARLPGASVPGVGGPSTSSAEGTVYLSAQEEAKLPGGSNHIGRERSGERTPELPSRDTGP